jgi:hypothetical protein
MYDIPLSLGLRHYAFDITLSFVSYLFIDTDLDSLSY